MWKGSQKAKNNFATQSRNLYSFELGVSGYVTIFVVLFLTTFNMFNGRFCVNVCFSM